MYEIKISPRISANLEDKHKVLLCILCNLEISNNAMEIYLGDTIGQPVLENGKSLLGLMVGLSSLYEALKNFDSIKRHIRESKIEIAPIQEEWIFLNSKEVTKFKETVLNYIRNKGSFHIDPLIISKYIESQNEDIVIWNSVGNLSGNSPLAKYSIEYWIELQFGNDLNETMGRFAKISAKLQFIVLYLISRWIEVTLISPS